MKNHIKHIAVLSLLIIIIPACKKTTSPTPAAKPDFRDAITGTYAGSLHHVFDIGTPPNASTADDSVGRDTVYVTKGPGDSTIVLNGTDAFSKFQLHDSVSLNYINGSSGGTVADFSLQNGVWHLFYRFNEEGSAYPTYDYSQAVKIR